MDRGKDIQKEENEEVPLFSQWKKQVADEGVRDGLFMRMSRFKG